MSISRRNLLSNAGKLAAASGLLAPGLLIEPLGGMAHASRIDAARGWGVGDIRVTALLDGFVEVDAAIFAEADPAERQALLEKAGQPGGKIALDVNAFLLERAGRFTLVDSGTCDLYGPTLGKVPRALKEIGVDPSDIEHVILTHMHNDHVGGLVGHDGEAAFPDAELHVPSAEWDYWTTEESYAAASEQARFSFTGARAANRAYRDRLRPFSGEGEILPGIFPVALPGHSVAHTGFRLAAGAEQMIIWGDIVVSPQVQFAHPEWASTFDADAQLSVDSRRRIFDEVATDGILVAGMHLPFPGVGYVAPHGLAYRFQPLG